MLGVVTDNESIDEWKNTGLSPSICKSTDRAQLSTIIQSSGFVVPECLDPADGVCQTECRAAVTHRSEFKHCFNPYTHTHNLTVKDTPTNVALHTHRRAANTES